MVQYRNAEGGFGLWLPSDWHQFELTDNRVGAIFSPYVDDVNTSIYAEKHNLEITVTVEDIETLREGFLEGIKSLPGVEIEEVTDNTSDKVNIFEARYTFLDGEARRKRWVRNIYWGDGQLVLIAQGRTPEDFKYWLPMFYNTLMTAMI